MHFFGMKRPTKPTTPAEIAVLIWCVIVLCVAVGVYCLWIGFQAPPDRAEYASTIQLCGVCFLAAGPAIWLVYRYVANLLNR